MSATLERLLQEALALTTQVQTSPDRALQPLHPPGSHEKEPRDTSILNDSNDSGFDWPAVSSPHLRLFPQLSWKLYLANLIPVGIHVPEMAGPQCDHGLGSAFGEHGPSLPTVSWPSLESRLGPGLTGKPLLFQE